MDTGVLGTVNGNSTLITLIQNSVEDCGRQQWRPKAITQVTIKHQLHQAVPTALYTPQTPKTPSLRTDTDIDSELCDHQPSPVHG